MTTLDAYYYLKQVHVRVAGGKAEPPNPDRSVNQPDGTHLLIEITAFLHRIFKTSVERIAFVLPPILASFTVIIYILWGYELGGPLVALLSCLAGTSSFYWYFRTSLGRFDTDCLNPFFVYSILFLTYEFAVSTGRRRFTYLLLSVSAAYVFGLWWVQVKILGFLLFLLPYAFSVFLPTSRLERMVKIALIAGIFSIGILYAIGGGDGDPVFLSNYVSEAAAQFHLIAGVSGSVFPEVGKSISELQPQSIWQIGGKVAGNVALLFASVAGLYCVVKRNAKAAFFLSFGLALSALSFFSQRFMIFLVPLYSLGFGFLLGSVVVENGILARHARHSIRCGIALVLAAALLAPGYFRVLSTWQGPLLRADDYNLAKCIPESKSSGKIIWSWWDYGYFLEYVSGSSAFIDGGSQSPARTFLAAYPLTCTDPILARNWIRFFAVRNVEGLKTLATRFGGVARAVDFLQKIFAEPDKADRILKRFGLSDDNQWKAYLFPEVEVYLFLNRDMIRKSYWWYYYGSWNPKTGEGIHPQVVLQKRDVEGLFGDGKLVRAEEGRIGLGRLLRSGNSVNGVLWDSVAFRLLFRKPKSTKFFVCLAHDPAVGGVWRVS